MQRELQFSCDATEDHTVEARPKALRVTREFAARLPQIAALLESDVRAAYQGDPAAKSIDEVRFCYPGITAITHHRIAHELYSMGVPLLARIIAELAHSTHRHRYPSGRAHRRELFHRSRHRRRHRRDGGHRRARAPLSGRDAGRQELSGRDEDGTLVKGIARHPIVEDDVVIYAGATILGRITHRARFDHRRQRLDHARHSSRQPHRAGAGAQ